MFGINIKTLRKEKNLKQKDLANILNTSQSTIGKYEREELEPNLTMIIKIANLFNCSVDYILGRELEDGTIIIKNNNQPTLTTKEKTLLNYFRQMNEDTKDIAIGILKGIVNA